MVSLISQYVFKTEPYTDTTLRTIHEELAKAMTVILKPSTDFLTSNKLLKVFHGLNSKDSLVLSRITVIVESLEVNNLVLGSVQFLAGPVLNGGHS